MLSAVSPVFKAMFTGQMKEATARDIPVAFSRAVIQCLVEFVYLGKVTVDPDTVVPLYAAADHYAIEGLIHICRECLEQKLSINNCFQWYIDSLNWGQLTEELAASCLAFIASHVSEALSSADFALLPYEAVLDLLQRSDLVVSEIAIFEGISLWIDGNAAAQSNQAKTLMENIRYPLISPVDLVSKVGSNPHKNLPNYICALEFHHLPTLNDITAPQFLPREDFPLLLTLTPLEVSFNPKPSQVVLPPQPLSYRLRTNEPVAVLVAKKDCRFSIEGQGSLCWSGHQHNYTLKFRNLPTVGTTPGEPKVIEISAGSWGRPYKYAKSVTVTHSFAITGKESSCVLSITNTEDCTIGHLFPIVVTFQVSCGCMGFRLTYHDHITDD